MLRNRENDMNKLKIMLCGDSISRGVVYDEIEKKYRICEKAFSKLLETIANASIFNISAFGNTVKKAERKFNRLFKKVMPDIVIFGLGGNDCDFDWDDISENPTEPHEPKTDVENFKKTLGSMADTVKKEGGRAVLMNLPPLDPDRYFRWITLGDGERAANILEWLGSVSKIYWWQEKYNAAVLKLAREKKLDVIDIRAEFLDNPDFREYLCEDGIHPNEKGQQLIARAVAQYVNGKTA